MRVRLMALSTTTLPTCSVRTTPSRSQGQFNNAGMDASQALNGCLGFIELDGDHRQGELAVPTLHSPALAKVVTTSQVS